MTFKQRNIKKSSRKKEVVHTAKTVVNGGFSLTKKLGSALGKGAKKTFRFAEKAQQKRNKKRRWRWVIGGLGIILGIFVVFEVTTRVTSFFQNFDLKDILWVAGADLPTDEYGHTNVLLLGVGGDDHSGGTLTDSVLIASIDTETQSVVVMSIPRDMWVQPETTNGGRINEVIGNVMSQYRREARDEGYNAGVAALKEVVKEITDIDIHYYAQINFNGFAEGVDALGGVDVVVDTTIDDYSYPTQNWGYEHFYLEAGEQHLDGQTALKYARSRYGSSDFERSTRQRKLMQSIQDKAISREILTSPPKLKELYAVVQNNTKTDLEWRDIIALAEIAYEFPREHIFSFGLNNDETKPGGFLVTPERERYGGAFVLVPFLNLTANKYERIRIFADNIFRKRYFHLQEYPITVLNATSTLGLAGTTATHFERFGITIAEVENSEEDLEQSEIRHPDTEQGRIIATQLQRYIAAILIPQPVPPVRTLPSGEEVAPRLDITVVVGSQHENYRIPLADDTAEITTSTL